MLDDVFGVRDLGFVVMILGAYFYITLIFKTIVGLIKQKKVG